MAKVCVIGAGQWGKNHVRVFHELGALRYVCDTQEAALKGIDFPGVIKTTSVDQALNDPEVDALVIASSAQTHFPLARRALDAGKHVLVEKPMAMTLAEANEMASLAREKGKVLMVGHLLRYHPAVRKLKQMISEGIIGRPYYIYSTRLNIGRIRREENVLLSLAPHDISVCLYLLGQEPIQVNSFGGAFLSSNIGDTTMTRMLFHSDVQVYIFVSWLHPYKEQRFVVVGQNGMLVFDDTDPKNKLVLYKHKIEWVGVQPVAKKEQGEPISFDAYEPLVEEDKHFLECIQNGTAPQTDSKEGLAVMRSLDAALLSLNQGGKATSPAPRHYFAHETAVIDAGVDIGEGTKVWHFSHVLSGSKIGRNCSIGQNVVIGPNVKIGNRVKIQNNVSVYEAVTLEDDVFCGPSMVFTNVINPRSFIVRKHEFKETLVKHGASMGANCTIVCGVTVGEYSFVAAGAVVTKDVKPYSLVAGVPARHLHWVCKCGIKLDQSSFKCPACSQQYKLDSGNLSPV